MDDVSNADRAAWALATLTAFGEITGVDEYDTAIGDLICDLHHFADQEGIDWQEVLDRADMHYTAEVEEEAEEEAEDASTETEHGEAVVLIGDFGTKPVPAREEGES